jgi:hypothetical protein
MLWGRPAISAKLAGQAQFGLNPFAEFLIERRLEGLLALRQRGLCCYDRPTSTGS